MKIMLSDNSKNLQTWGLLLVKFFSEISFRFKVLGALKRLLIVVCT
jgi:hypothetical protein